ncbi:hypothetical protein, partial [Haematobacter massiliensis]|uniref:hypothetical protein n=1 Tax=Haematobacter massiliensis TaxID=195105 RepID=UPI001B802A24
QGDHVGEAEGPAHRPENSSPNCFLILLLRRDNAPAEARSSPASHGSAATGIARLRETGG